MPQKQIKILLSVALILISTFFLFSRLGHYALWDDEAICALYGKSLWENGDTYAVLDNNIVAFSWGRELKNLCMRYIPPLQFYISAPWAAHANGSSFMVRFPFAVIGLCTIGLMLFWMWKSPLSLTQWGLMCLGILGNTSLFLHLRHCRYYAPAIFFSLALLYLYWNRKNTLLHSILCALAALCLLASNYLCFASVAGCLLVDYLIWGRKERPYNLKTLATGFLPFAVGCYFIISNYNPLGMDVWGIETKHTLLFKITLFFWNLRDLNACEMGVGILILFSIAIYLGNNDVKYIRGTAAILLYCLVTAIFSPQPDGGLHVANVRYLAPLIPLCIFVAVMTLQYICHKKEWLIWPLAILAFGTNLLHGGPWVGVDRSTPFTVALPQAHLKSSVFDFTRELLHPHTSAFRKTAEWIQSNIKPNETIWVVPTYMNYPLIFHAPHPTYAWQILEKKGQFENLPDIHFFNRIPPDYIIAFGPIIKPTEKKMHELEGRNIYYKEIALIDTFWYDLIRAEMFWHSFDEITDYSRKTQAIRIFKRIEKSI